MKLPKKAPDATADSVPQSRWDKIVSMTPVVMTVVATILAGLSSSEMSIAQYHRAVAAQNQSKAGDQWAFYQAKKLREATMDASLDVMRGTRATGSMSPARLGSGLALVENDHRLALGATQPDADEITSPSSQPATRSLAKMTSAPSGMRALLVDPAHRQSLTMLTTGKLPKIEDRAVNTPAIQKVLDAMDRGEDETQTASLTRAVSADALAQAFRAADADSRAWDAASKPITQLADQLSASLAGEAAAARDTQRDRRDHDRSAAGDTAPTTAPSAEAERASAWEADAQDLLSDFTAAKLRWSALRYAADARYNLASARLYEVQVRRSSADSERHRDRSKDFFYGMLAAQAAVTIATFSLALKQRSLLWSLATVAGLAAIGLGIYVYLFT